MGAIFDVPETYSQCGEDLLIRNFSKGKAKGFYVDVGANDPVLNNNTYLFYKSGWSGINIEPNFRLWRRIRAVRPRDITLNIGCAESAGSLKFYEFRPSGLSTFSEEVARENEKYGHRIKSVAEVQVKTLREVLTGYAQDKEIDFLTVDTEGYDLNVLEGNDWQQFRPKLVILETLEYRGDGSGKRLGPVYDPFMKQLGYEKISDNYLNTVYIEQNYLKAL